MEVDQEMSSAPSTDQEPMADQAAGDEAPESAQQSAKENKEPGRKKDVSHKDTITLESKCHVDHMNHDYFANSSRTTSFNQFPVS